MVLGFPHKESFIPRGPGDDRYLIGLRGLILSTTLDQNKNKLSARKISPDPGVQNHFGMTLAKIILYFERLFPKFVLRGPSLTTLTIRGRGLAKYQRY